jgi:hypothetical protein
MAGALFYVDTLPDVGGVATVSGDEGFHAASVRRIRRGEQMLLGNGTGELAHCEVELADRGGLTARVLERWRVRPPDVDLPEPDGPITTTVSDGSTLRVQPLSTWVAPKLLSIPMISSRCAMTAL